MKIRHIAAILILLLMGQLIIFAQETVTMPDLTGLSVPEAAAQLNSLGLASGTETAVDISDANGVEVGFITTQSVAANTDVEIGSVIDIGVVRTANAILIYDDNDLTVVNTTNNVADVTGLRFVAIEGDNPASFAATRWASNVREHRCLQVWSIPRNNAKSLDECENIQHWLTTNTTGEHFWTATNGVTTFSVVEDGIERAQCPAADEGTQDAPLRCEFYLAGASSADDIAPYIYFAYTTEAIIAYNPTPNRWMPTDRTTITNLNPNLTNPGVTLVMGDPELFQNPEIVADITQLAPEQCIMLTAGVDNPTMPQECNVIAQRTLDANIAFWLADFEIDSATDTQVHTCPAAVAGQPTICIVPQ